MNRKSPQDQSPTYLQRQSQAWCKVHKERVRSMIKQKRLCLDAKLIYMGLLTYLHDGGGVLIESRERVAKSLGFETERLDYCIGKLEEEGWLEFSEAGAIFEPTVYKYITGNEHPDDAESSRISQDLAKSGRILHSSPGETSAVEYSRELVGTPTPLTNCTTEQNNRKEGDSLTLAPFPGLTEKDLEAVKERFADLVFADVYAKFVTRANRDGKKSVTLNYLRGFFDLERKFLTKKSGSAATASPVPAKNKQVKAKPEPEESKETTGELPKLEFRNCAEHMRNELGDYGKEIRKPFGWFIGDKKVADWGLVNPFVDQCRNMPAGNAEECRQYLLSLTPKVKDWDTRDALDRFDVLFTEANWDEDGFKPIEWSGTETAEKEAKKEEAAIS